MPTDTGIGIPAMVEPLREQAIAVPTSTSEVIINKVSNGFVMRIGCKVLVARTWKEVSEGLALYFKDPNTARMKYCEDEHAALKPGKRGTIGDLLRSRRRQKRGSRKAKK